LYLALLVIKTKVTITAIVIIELIAIIFFLLLILSNLIFPHSLSIFISFLSLLEISNLCLNYIISNNKSQEKVRYFA